MRIARECPECRGTNLYKSDASAGGGHAPNYLPGLGSFLFAGRFDIVLCRDCGLTRFFAQPEARGKVADSRRWTRLP